MCSKHAKINLNAAGNEDGGGLVASYLEGRQVLQGLCPKIRCIVG